MLLAGPLSAQTGSRTTDHRPGAFPSRHISLLLSPEDGFYPGAEIGSSNRDNADFRVIASRCDARDFTMPAAGLQPSDSSRNIYNSAGDQVEVLQYGYSNGFWLLNSHVINTYDNAHHLTGYTYQTWNGSAWVNGNRTFYTLDAQGNPTLVQYQDWINEAWVNSGQELYTYNAGSLPTLIVFQFWDSSLSQWVNERKFIYDYGTDDLVDTYIIQFWENDAWENYLRSTTTYNGQGNPAMELEETWNGTAWEKEELETNTYDANNNLVSRLIQTWNGSTWENITRFSYAYDGNGQILQFLYQSWGNNAWINLFKLNYAYDEDGNLAEDSQSNWENGLWVVYGNCVYYYETFTGVFTPSGRDFAFRLTPNPAGASVSLAVTGVVPERLRIYDLLGRTLVERGLLHQPEQAIDLGMLAPGLYVLRIEASGGQAGSRLLEIRH